MDHASFTDSSGVPWLVKEDGADESRAHGSSEGVPGTAWLRFESDLEVRRLWHYPDDWRGLSPLQLESLLERASTVVARFRSVRHANPVLDPGISPTPSRGAIEATTRTPRPPAASGSTRKSSDDLPDDPDAP